MFLLDKSQLYKFRERQENFKIFSHRNCKLGSVLGNMSFLEHQMERMV